MTITYLGVIRHGKTITAVVGSSHSRFAAPIATGAANLSADPATTAPALQDIPVSMKQGAGSTPARRGEKETFNANAR